MSADFLLISFSDGKAALLTAQMLYVHAVEEAEFCPWDDDEEDRE